MICCSQQLRKGIAAGHVGQQVEGIAVFSGMQQRRCRQQLPAQRRTAPLSPFLSQMPGKAQVVCGCFPARAAVGIAEKAGEERFRRRITDVGQGQERRLAGRGMIAFCQ